MATVTEFAQRFFQRFARLARYVALRRQLAEINRTLGADRPATGSLAPAIAARNHAATGVVAEKPAAAVKP
mgnify:CR=1 FL=1